MLNRSAHATILCLVIAVGTGCPPTDPIYVPRTFDLGVTSVPYDFSTAPVVDLAPVQLTWKRQQVGAGVGLLSVWGVGTTVALAAGFSTFVTQDINNGWTELVDMNNYVTAVWLRGVGDVAGRGWIEGYGAGSGLTYMPDTVGAMWSMPAFTAQTFNAVWGTTGSNQRTYAATTGAVYVATGDYRAATPCAGIVAADVNHGIWGLGTEVYVVGHHAAGGASVQYAPDGMAFSLSVLPSTQVLYSVWGPSADDVFAVGTNGGIYRTRDHGASWKFTRAGAANLFAVWGSSAVDIWIAGANATVLHSTDDGTTWAPLSIGQSSADVFHSIWGTGPGDIYIVGENGSLFHGAP